MSSAARGLGGREVVIVEATRTPIGRGHLEKGYYRDLQPSNLLAKVYGELFERTGVDPPRPASSTWATSPLPTASKSWRSSAPPSPELDELGVRSQELAAKATEEGRFGREIVPMQVNGVMPKER